MKSDRFGHLGAIWNRLEDIDFEDMAYKIVFYLATILFIVSACSLIKIILFGE
jgi:hypothetical protein